MENDKLASIQKELVRIATAKLDQDYEEVRLNIEKLWKKGGVYVATLRSHDHNVFVLQEDGTYTKASISAIFDLPRYKQSVYEKLLPEYVRKEVHVFMSRYVEFIEKYEET